MSHFNVVETTGPLIIGSGVAGLSTALSLGECTVVTKTGLGAGSSIWAQGGIAAAVGKGDSPRRHAADTIAVSGGIADTTIATAVTAQAPDRIQWLRDLGARFDTTDGELALGREAGHGRSRIVHAHGDATGKEIMRTLSNAIRAQPDIDVVEGFLAVDLAIADGSVVGVFGIQSSGARTLLLAPATVLATGGIGQVFAHTTNPAEATADGLAMAARAGARLADLEFVQFHPTALDVGLDPMPLLTEALRGAGAYLLDDAGDRFMVKEHPAGELAPRDIVARAIWARQVTGHRITMDARHIEDISYRFPTVYGFATSAGIDPATTPMPVSPAAHYHMGGVATDSLGRTSLQGLWATGEVACTGLHGANRLASNSLLEGLATAHAVARDIRASEPKPPHIAAVEIPPDALHLERRDDVDVRSRIRDLMSSCVGVTRHQPDMERARERLNVLATSSIIVFNLLTAARLITAAALARTESRGSHYRTDYPDPDPRQAQRSIVDPEPVQHTVIRPLVPLS